MSQNTATERPGGEPDEAPRGIFGRILLFLRQVFGELRKVHTPTRGELVQYVLVVLVFVAFMMALISLLDLGFGQLAMLVFGEGTIGS
ncbi:preprotein translocase subunit SecE [Kocuria sp. JC486]|uniref:Protein translocase subunit SecE n=1 Tax=Kocuria soli TaxID=2485125 RepID=A0A3N3ZTG1_9MICC|nr:MULTISPECIES: preprotein translocase subunit SecE [Kocuria]NHU84730.1 preprotein translocase subunit SecE [Kocuria sp. JC486]ROZ63467.1 preprotein translocase subunit SecE [Kocuria soli]